MLSFKEHFRKISEMYIKGSYQVGEIFGVLMPAILNDKRTCFGMISLLHRQLNQ